MLLPRRAAGLLGENVINYCCRYLSASCGNSSISSLNNGTELLKRSWNRKFSVFTTSIFGNSRKNFLKKETIVIRKSHVCSKEILTSCVHRFSIPSFNVNNSIGQKKFGYFRKNSHRYFSLSTMNSANGRKKLVILGTGWGGYSVVKNINKKLYDVVVISPRNHFLFTPLLNSTTVGTLEFRSIIEPIRNTKFRDDHHFQLSEAVCLNAKENRLICKTMLTGQQYDITYDKLVIAVGCTSNTFGIPGVEEHTFFMKEISDARKVRDRIVSNFELSLYPTISLQEREKLLHFVIVGGGPTGVEFGAELYDFITRDVSRLYPGEKGEVKVTLIEGQSILPSFDQKLREFAERKIKQRKNFTLLKDFVVEVGDGFVKLKSGQILKTGLVVWSTGLAPRPFVDVIDLPKNKTKQLLVDDCLKVIGQENVYALGDCSSIKGNPHPCTAQVAERQGRYLCSALEADAKNKKFVKPFAWIDMGMMAYIGGYQGVTNLPPKAGKLTGFKSWLLWRSVYLTKLGSWRNRMQVPFDWARTFFFGRDTSRF